MSTPEYEIFAIPYATREGTRKETFLGGDPHDGPIGMTYYIWLVRNAERTIVVDMGFHARSRRAAQALLWPPAARKPGGLGVDADEVANVVVTHLHWDHVGGFETFPKAQFHLQDDEMAFATGRHMSNKQLSNGYEVNDVVGMVRLVYKNRVTFYKGTATLAPGISLHRIGGHTHGLQCVRVATKRGWVVLASDAVHYYEQMEKNIFFRSVFDLGEMVDGYRIVNELAESRDHVIPGHDPLVMSKYRAPSRSSRASPSARCRAGRISVVTDQPGRRGTRQASPAASPFEQRNAPLCCNPQIAG